MNQREENRFLSELRRRLQKAPFATQQTEDNYIAVSYEGNPLCRAMSDGTVLYREEDVTGGKRRSALDRVTDLAASTLEYVRLMEQSSRLEASGLEGDYRLLTDFNGAVLAGHYTEYGPQFVTWERDYDRTGIHHGHYFESFEMAKRDFSVRSGLVEEQRLFSDEQLAEVYRCLHETLESGYPLTAERQRTLEYAAYQIEQSVPELERLVEVSNQKETEYIARMEQGIEMG